MFGVTVPGKNVLTSQQGDIEGLTCPTCRHEVSKTQRLSKARALDTMIQRWVQRRLARGPWAEFEDWTYRTR
jgi:hypothetical protein